jgi:hypothetical protein
LQFQYSPQSTEEDNENILEGRASVELQIDYLQNASQSNAAVGQ